MKYSVLKLVKWCTCNLLAVLNVFGSPLIIGVICPLKVLTIGWKVIQPL